MDAWGFVQWPATAATIYASWLVASSHEARRNAGFWWFLASNVLWVVWALHDHAHALIVLQVGLAAMNIRGMLKTNAQHDPASQRS